MAVGVAVPVVVRDGEAVVDGEGVAVNDEDGWAPTDREAVVVPVGDSDEVEVAVGVCD